MREPSWSQENSRFPSMEVARTVSSMERRYGCQRSHAMALVESRHDEGPEQIS